MKRHSLKLSLVALAAFAPGCGGIEMLLGDGGGSKADMAMGATPDMMWYQLKAGVYTVTAVRSDAAKDGCKVDPFNMMAPLVGKTFALQNNGMGVIKFGSIDAMTNNTPAAACGAISPNALPAPTHCANRRRVH